MSAERFHQGVTASDELHRLIFALETDQALPQLSQFLTVHRPCRNRNEPNALHSTQPLLGDSRSPTQLAHDLTGPDCPFQFQSDK